MDSISCSQGTLYNIMRVENREKKGESSAWTLCSGLPKVENREKKGESSAWLARSGAPARQFRRAYIEEGMNHEIHEIHERGNNRTTNGASRD